VSKYTTLVTVASTGPVSCVQTSLLESGANLQWCCGVVVNSNYGYPGRSPARFSRYTSACVLLRPAS
jgi:hypothetical protein